MPTIDTNGDGIPDTGDGIINDKDRTTIGNGLPTCTGGFTNSFTYKKLGPQYLLAMEFRK